MTAILATIDELRARVTEKGPWFSVPPDAQAKRCKGCDAQIYFAQQPSGKLMPIDVLVPGGQMPRRELISNGETFPAVVGRGVSHYATCPAGAQFRRPR
ncbi:MAG TPA: hypothetical protein VFZ98_11210 [Vicinamibacterales bacterium]